MAGWLGEGKGYTVFKEKDVARENQLSRGCHSVPGISVINRPIKRAVSSATAVAIVVIALAEFRGYRHCRVRPLLAQGMTKNLSP